LDKELSQPDHLGVVFERLGERDHGVASILLITDPTCSEECTSSFDGDLVALSTSSSLVLQPTKSVAAKRVSRQERTHAGLFPGSFGIGGDLGNTLLE
jgi:hypothetical protein